MGALLRGVDRGGRRTDHQLQGPPRLPVERRLRRAHRRRRQVLLRALPRHRARRAQRRKLGAARPGRRPRRNERHHRLPGALLRRVVVRSPLRDRLHRLQEGGRGSGRHLLALAAGAGRPLQDRGARPEPGDRARSAFRMERPEAGLQAGRVLSHHRLQGGGERHPGRAARRSPGELEHRAPPDGEHAGRAQDGAQVEPGQRLARNEHGASEALRPAGPAGHPQGDRCRSDPRRGVLRRRRTRPRPGRQGSPRVHRRAAAAAGRGRRAGAARGSRRRQPRPRARHPCRYRLRDRGPDRAGQPRRGRHQSRDRHPRGRKLLVAARHQGQGGTGNPVPPLARAAGSQLDHAVAASGAGRHLELAVVRQQALRGAALRGDGRDRQRHAPCAPGGDAEGDGLERGLPVDHPAAPAHRVARPRRPRHEAQRRPAPGALQEGLSGRRRRPCVRSGDTRAPQPRRSSGRSNPAPVITGGGLCTRMTETTTNPLSRHPGQYPANFRHSREACPLGSGERECTNHDGSRRTPDNRESKEKTRGYRRDRTGKRGASGVA